MKDVFVRTLAEEFNFMRRGASFEEQKANGELYDLYAAFGCECGSGWYTLLQSLCTEITSAYERAFKLKN